MREQKSSFDNRRLGAAHPMIHKVILRYRKPHPLNFGRPQKQSTYRTDAGIEDARAFAAKWAASAHVASVTIHQARTLLETIKPQHHD